MKFATLLVLVSTVLGGCVVAPVGGPPEYYAAPPAVVVQPYGYYGYYRGPHHRYWR